MRVKKKAWIRAFWRSQFRLVVSVAYLSRLATQTHRLYTPGPVSLINLPGHFSPLYTLALSLHIRGRGFLTSCSWFCYIYSSNWLCCWVVSCRVPRPEPDIRSTETRRDAIFDFAYFARLRLEQYCKSWTSLRNHTQWRIPDHKRRGRASRPDDPRCCPRLNRCLRPRWAPSVSPNASSMSVLAMTDSTIPLLFQLLLLVSCLPHQAHDTRVRFCNEACRHSPNALRLVLYLASTFLRVGSLFSWVDRATVLTTSSPPTV